MYRKKVLVEQENNNIDSQDNDIWSLYLFALKSPVTRQKYKTRLDKFFNFIDLEGKTVEQKSNSFIEKHEKEGGKWVFHSILRFMQFHLERVNRKKITGSTIENLYAFTYYFINRITHPILIAESRKLFYYYLVCDCFLPLLFIIYYHIYL